MKNNLPVMLLKRIVLLPLQDVRLDLNNDISSRVIDVALNKNNGEILIDHDDGRGEGKVAVFHRIITPSKTVIKSTLYKAADSESLTDEEYRRLTLMLRAMLSFISRNRLQSTVERLAFYDEAGYPNLNYFSRHLEMLNEKGKLSGNTAIQFNLQHFSLINQEIGRDAGDIVLRNYFTLIK